MDADAASVDASKCNIHHEIALQAASNLLAADFTVSRMV